MEIFNAVIEFYDRSKENAPWIKGKVLDVLQHYPHPRTQAIAWERLCLNDGHDAALLLKILQNTGVKEEEIAQFLYSSLQSDDAAISNAAFYVFYHHFSEEYWPERSEMLEVLVKNFAENEKKYLHEPGLNKMVLKLIHPNPSGQLKPLLYHRLPSVQEGTLALINKLYEDESVHFRLFLSPLIIARCWELANDDDALIAQQALNLLRKVAYEERHACQNFIFPLLAIIHRQTHHSEVVLEAMGVINLVLPTIPYPIQIEPHYLSALSNRDYRFRVAALQGFKFTKNISRIRALAAEYQNDPVPEVQVVAKELGQLVEPGFGVKFLDDLWNFLSGYR